MLNSPIPWLVALNVMGVNLIAPVLPEYAAHFGVGFAAASTIVTTYALARMSVRLLSGTLSDKHGSRLICTGGGLVQASGSLLAAVAPGFAVLLIARAIQGVGSSMFGTSINRYLLVVTDKEDLGRATAGFQTGILIGGTIGPLIGGITADRLGIFAPFYLQAFVGVLLAGVSLSYVHDRPGARAGGLDVGPAEPVRSIRSLLTIPGFTLIMFLGFGLFFIRAGAMNVLLPAYADEIFALSTSRIGVLISLSTVVSVVVMPLAGNVADSIGRLPVALTGAFATAGSVMLFGVADSTTTLFVVSAVIGAGIGLTAVAIPTMMGDLAPPGTEGRVSGVYRMANDMGWIIGPTILGLLADSSRYGLAFLVAGFPLLIGALLLARSKAVRS